MLSAEDLEKRKRIMSRSLALGHCICDPRKPCPCPVFTAEGVCECAGERRPVQAGPVRLTELVRNPGCASKISKQDLQRALAGLPDIEDPRILVGRAAGDDAGVMMLGGGERTATILTVDVFAPALDNPYQFGQAAAANSVSDVYAMGGTPQVALSIIGFPAHALPLEIMREILRGGIEKMAEAGISVIGGHSINDGEIKFGFAVVGHVDRDAIVTNAAPQAGDCLVLTKPLGGGLIAFAHQLGRAPEGAVQALTRSMCALNRVAGERLREFGAHAATDVTGFGLLGHLAEIARHGNVEVRIDFDRVPLFPGVRDLARSDVIPGGVERNRESVPAELLQLGALTPAQQALLYCPETSGGLLVFLPPRNAEAYVKMLRESGAPETAIIGEAVRTHPRGLISGASAETAQWQTARVQPRAPVSGGRDRTGAAEPCCANYEAPAAQASAAGGAPGTTAESGAAEGKLLVPAAHQDDFKAYMAAVNQPGALAAKQIKLINLALSVANRCAPCVKSQTKAARDCGASAVEIAEAVALAVSFGGGPVNMFYQELLQRESRPGA